MLIFLPYMKYCLKISQQFYRQLSKKELKCLEKIICAWFIYKKFQVMSTIYKLSGCDFFVELVEV